MSARALRDALAALGLDARVEPRERLAVLHLADPSPLADAALRAAATALAAEHGFTHVALELAAESGVGNRDSGEPMTSSRASAERASVGTAPE